MYVLIQTRYYVFIIVIIIPTINIMIVIIIIIITVMIVQIVLLILSLLLLYQYYYYYYSYHIIDKLEHIWREDRCDAQQFRKLFINCSNQPDEPEMSLWTYRDVRYVIQAKTVKKYRNKFVEEILVLIVIYDTFFVILATFYIQLRKFCEKKRIY